MENQSTDDKPRSRALINFAVGAFFFSGVIHLVQAHWLDAAFFISGGLVFLFGKRIDRLPRAVRYLTVAVFASLAVAMFVELIISFRAHG